MSPPEIDAAIHRQLGELVAGMQDSIRRMEEASRWADDKSEASRCSPPARRGGGSRGQDGTMIVTFKKTLQK